MTDLLLQLMETSERARVYGVAIGIVTDNKDPQGMGRVKVRLPALLGDDSDLWARIATLMAGKDRGTFFLPEVDDEVLVAFEHGDVSRPYILGALWNGKDTPPEDNADGKNNLRLIKSRSGHLIRLDDSDGKEKIEIIDKSGNNSIVIDTSNKTITVTSAKDITLDASQGTIKLSAQTIELSSASNSKIKADGQLTLEAASTTTIKGATVNIN